MGSAYAAIFPLIFRIGTNTWETLRCFLYLPHLNKQVYTSEARHFQYTCLPLANHQGLIQQLLSASASHYQHEKVKEMCCHGYMVCHLCSRKKNICVSPSFVSAFFHTFLPPDQPDFPASRHASDLRGQRTLHNSSAVPTQVPQKGIHSFSAVTSADYDAGVTGKKCSTPY